MNIVWSAPKRGNHIRHKSSSHVLVSIHKNGSKCQKQTVFYFSKPVMEKLGWLVGDRVLIGYDDSKLYVKRSVGDGYKLSPNGNTKEERAEAEGKPFACSTKISGAMIGKPIAIDVGSLKIENSVLIINKE